MPDAIAWTPAEDGATVGHTGAEGGEIWKDEECPDGARITLERDTLLGAPFAISCAVYGWLVQTRFFADEPTAVQQYEIMKTALAEIAELVVAERSTEAADAVDRFSEQFP
ncbi:MAG: hypothetical protein U0452_13105 [Anaerolineae bacterium]